VNPDCPERYVIVLPALPSVLNANKRFWPAKQGRNQKFRIEITATRRLPFTVYRLPFTVYRLPLAVRGDRVDL
jgi:hypothetical protein